MNREQKRNKEQRLEAIKNLTFLINTLEEFNKLDSEERILAIEELKKELEKLL